MSNSDREWDQVTRAAAELQHSVPDAVPVGGAAVAMLDRLVDGAP